MRAYSTQIAAPASTGSTSYTSWPFQPKALLISYTGQTSGTIGTVTSNAISAVGLTTAAKQVCVSMFGEDSVSHDANAAGAHSDGYVIRVVDGSGTVILSAQLVSLNSDGVTLDFITTSSGYLINVLAIGGDEITGVYIKEVVAPGSTGTVDYTGFGFDPEHFISIGSLHTATPSSIDSTYGYTGFGFCDSSLNQIASGGSSFGSPTNYQRLYSGALYVQSSDSATISQRMAISAKITGGFTGNWAVSAASGPYLWVLGIAGGSSKVGYTAARTSTGATTISSVAFQPKSIVTLANGAQNNTALLYNDLCVGFCGETTTNAIATAIHNGGTKNSNCKRYYNTNKIFSAVTSTLLKEATLTSYNSNGFTMTYTTADTTAMDVGYMLLGGDEPVAASLKTRTLMGVGL